MKKYSIRLVVAVSLVACLLVACSKSGGGGEGTGTPPPVVVQDTSITNATHLNSLNVQVTFENGQKGAGVYIYANAPYYTPADAPGEGFTCVDDVARALLYYVRSQAFATDTSVQQKAFGMTRFVLNMQSPGGYFYNFLQTGDLINKYGPTSVNQPKWWSWRALQALTEAAPVISTKDAALAGQMGTAIDKLITAIKTDLVNTPQTTLQTDGIDIPQWLPEGADQAATLILALIPYSRDKGDAVIKTYIRKLADGIVLMQAGGPSQYPYGAFLSSGTTWHAYGNEQASALFAAAAFLADASYATKAKVEVDNFYPWLLSNGYQSSFQLKKENNIPIGYNQSAYEQIAYGIRPMVFAAIDAYKLTNDEQYATMAGRIAAWFWGNNSASAYMYATGTGICYDAIATGNVVNRNSGAESTIEALLTMQRVSSYPSVKAALNKYKK